MRSIKELLQLMLDNEHMFKTGLCMWAMDLDESNLITDDEYYLLGNYIRNNRPIIGWIRYYTLSVFFRDYYWKYGNIKPRIKWLKKHIKKN